MQKYMGKSCPIEREPMQLGDVKITHSDNKKLYEWIEFKAKTRIDLESKIL